MSILFIAYVSRIWVDWPGFQVRTFLYFSLGAFFAINRLNFVELTYKYRYAVIASFVIFLIPTTYYDGSNTLAGQNYFPFFVFSGVFATILLGGLLVGRYGLRANELLVSSCFFIYAIHVAPMIGVSTWVKKALKFITPSDNACIDIIVYFATPFITAAVCIVILIALRRLFPRVALILSGNKS